MLKRILVPIKFYQGELNPFDMTALEVALDKAEEVIALSMTPSVNHSAMENLTRIGVRAVMITDGVFAGSDTLVTAKVLATAIKRFNADAIFCGRQSVDGDTAQVPPMISELLGLKYYPKVVGDNGNLVLRDGREVSLISGALYTFEKFKPLRFPSIFSKKGEVEILTNNDLGLAPSEVGQKGSPTKVVRSFESQVGRRFCKFVNLEEIPSIVKASLNKTKQKEFKESTEKADTVYYFGDIEKMAKTIGNKAIPFDDCNKTIDQIQNEIINSGAEIILFSDTERHKELASRLAVRLGAGLCADCISLSIENGKFIMTRPALGGNITADIECRSKIKMATVRTASAKSNDVIVSVGLGATHRLNDIKEIVKAKGYELCATRLAVDNGFMPYESQVGLTGRVVCPKVYIALGLSGAVQHTSAIENAGVIIAINKDKNARIFDYADYGVICEI